MATEIKIEKGCLYRRKNRPTIYVKFTPRTGAKPIQLSTGKTPGQVKGQKLTLADFCRLPANEDPDDRGGQFWQYLVANRAGNTRNRHRDILKNQTLRTSGDIASMTWNRSTLRSGNSGGSVKSSAQRF